LIDIDRIVDLDQIATYMALKLHTKSIKFWGYSLAFRDLRSQFLL